jgi:hypothetical protein
MAAGTVFTTLHFLLNLRIGPKAGLFQNTKLKRFTSVKHSNLLGQFVSYEENEVLQIWQLVPYSQHSIFFITYESAQ